MHAQSDLATSRCRDLPEENPLPVKPVLPPPPPVERGGAGGQCLRGVALGPPTWYDSGKQVLDWVLGLALLVLSAPLILLTGLVIRLTSRGPVLYSQTRMGQNGRLFTLYKIRTMYHDCERHSGPRWSRPGDSRVLPLGRLLRKTHLDELPQLWNVLRGEMSLVGPRPERSEFIPQLEQAIPHYRGRLLVRPGLTGLAQVQLPPDTDLASVRLKLAYDLYYVRQHGLWLDLRILAGTAFVVLGVPWPVLRKLALIPDPDVIERTYRALGGEGLTGQPCAQAI